ncbi:excinuclease ABC subunit UvrC [Luminiphilus sp.]|nr:excinuclease ABC subunit UvrC [Luminiphilus sp.]MDA8985808.1 excinuclease ABC subunit UvrC [Luminiphilus sp.]MDA9942662.1 excinuclease ABC subunit UvrC [Luminiphilus sp.]MDB2643487.1 excinuclease ABC subunit UvrC [Luminiphilus sp.]MDB4048944.1 excinuclease ABC subunit UvrC [Luminiphilus sp.]MDC1116867.1 excinuclease ABC subunit UvrC [Luminiphilus sp.]
MSDFDAESYLAQLTSRPGVYQMFDREGGLLYVGKAKNLKSRVTSYFRPSGLSTKTMALVAKIANIEVTVTSTERDALLLEHNLIKQYRPPYNILLKDDKSYPYIYLSSDDRWPRLSFHRGAKRRKGTYFGPYPSSGAVRSTLHLMQKVFKVRQCRDSYFRNRSRPCLQYQIGRCSGPCVGLVSDQDYQEQVEKSTLFLNGQSHELMSRLADEMETAAAALAYEDAADLRDQIAQLQNVQSTQSIEGTRGDLDLMAVFSEHGHACIQVLFVREARVLGSRSYYPNTRLDEAPTAILEAFLPQFYLSTEQQIPQEIVLSHRIDDQGLLEDTLAAESGRKVSIKHSVRDARARWLQMAVQTAETNLRSFLAGKQTMAGRLESLRRALDLESIPLRMECFDISHSSGEATVASCVVFDGNGARKADYRKFNIDGIVPGDDYAAMQQALERRYKRLANGEGQLPDILFIDGGKGQVSQARQVLATYDISSVKVIGVAKGTTRKAGFETLVDADSGTEMRLRGDHPGLHLIQQIRDEAHRFAISGHRGRRAKARKQSVLEEIPGVGAKRRRELLRHFGSAKAIENAGIEELAKIKGISATIARTIYEHLHTVND